MHLAGILMPARCMVIRRDEYRVERNEQGREHLEWLATLCRMRRTRGCRTLRPFSLLLGAALLEDPDEQDNHQDDQKYATTDIHSFCTSSRFMKQESSQPHGSVTNRMFRR